MDRFELPRLDWHDSEGRIYKDALIENFNAIEAKLGEINELSAFSVQIPDISTISLDDVTLESDDNKIVNLRSFLTIFNLINYPIELSFTGNKIKRLAYWNDEFNYVEKANMATGANSTNKFIVYDFSDDSVVSVATVSELQENEKLIGCYDNGRIITLTTPYSARLNLLYLLGNMKSFTQNFTARAHDDYPKFKDGMQAMNVNCESGGQWGFDNPTIITREGAE